VATLTGLTADPPFASNVTTEVAALDELGGTELDGACDEDDGVAPHAARTMANKGSKKLDLTLECIKHLHVFRTLYIWNVFFVNKNI
jgi:hypothetical protein